MDLSSSPIQTPIVAPIDAVLSNAFVLESVTVNADSTPTPSGAASELSVSVLPVTGQSMNATNTLVVFEEVSGFLCSRFLFELTS